MKPADSDVNFEGDEDDRDDGEGFGDDAGDEDGSTTIDSIL